MVGITRSKVIYFHPYLGRWSNLTNMFQMGWFNHQLVGQLYMVIYDTKIPGWVMMEIAFSSHVCVGRVYSWRTKSTNFKKRLGYIAGRFFSQLYFGSISQAMKKGSLLTNQDFMECHKDFEVCFGRSKIARALHQAKYHLKLKKELQIRPFQNWAEFSKQISIVFSQPKKPSKTNQPLKRDMFT